MMRLVRLIRLLNIFKELWLVVSGLMRSIATLAWVSLLGMLLLYVCAILLTQQIGHNELYYEYKALSGGWDAQEYFGTVARTMYTLYEIVLQDSWNSTILRHVVANQPGLIFFFFIFMMLTTYGLLNLVVGVIVENTLTAAKNNEVKIKEAAEKQRKRNLDYLKEIFLAADKDKSGDISQEEFFECLQNPNVKRKL